MTMPEVLTKPIHISPRRLCHVNIFVSDVERSVAFYNQTCGLEVVMRQPGIKAGFLSNGNTHHDIGMIQATKDALFGEQGHRILAPGQGSEPGLYHLGWEMESEFELVKAYKRAVEAGLQIWRTVRHRASHSIYIFDPDGNVHEFYADVDKDWRRLYSQETSLSGEWTPGSKPATVEPQYDDNPEIRRVETAPLHPLRFSHAVLVARNWERMQAFFENVVGLFERGRSDEAGVVAYGAPRSPFPNVLGLVRQGADAGPRDKGLHHFGFQMPSEEEVARSEAALRAAGVTPAHTVDTPDKRSVFVRDPDGMLIEFCYRRDLYGRGDKPPADAFHL